jgi:hypothetical protein
VNKENGNSVARSMIETSLRLNIRSWKGRKVEGELEVGVI